jgi:hypothetical protein
MSQMPPVPPSNRSLKGPGADRAAEQAGAAPPRQNLAEQGRQGNIKQNTTHQGHHR